MIRFLSPDALWLLLALPALAAVYFLLLRRTRKPAKRYATLLSANARTSKFSRIQRHMPAVLLLLGLATLIVAGARPTAKITLPSQKETIVLAIDVSRSMSADDISPNRLSAAQSAARTFIEAQPSDARIGVVSFSTSASMVQVPTSDRDAILDAIDRLQLQNHTAIGTGILVSLQAIFPQFDVDLISENLRPASGYSSSPILPRGEAGNKKQEAGLKPVPAGSYTSAAIVLLSDGQATTGPDPVEAAMMAADRGVRIFTVGIGTPGGTIVNSNGMAIRVVLDEETLKKIADVTKGEYFYANNSTDLTKVYQSLSTRLVIEKKDTELTALFALAGAIFTLLSGTLSILWFNRIL